MAPLLVPEQQQQQLAMVLLNVRMTQLVLGSAGSGGDGWVHSQDTRLLEVMSWPGDNALNTLLPTLLPAHLAAAPPSRGNLGTPELCSPSPKPPLVPKHLCQLGEASSSCSLLLCLLN